MYLYVKLLGYVCLDCIFAELLYPPFAGYIHHPLGIAEGLHGFVVLGDVFLQLFYHGLGGAEVTGSVLVM